MSGFYYALSIAGIFVIIRWFIRNDGQSQTSGLLAMKRTDVAREGLESERGNAGSKTESTGRPDLARIQTDRS
jgi:hypothetical protein